MPPTSLAVASPYWLTYGEAVLLKLLDQTSIGRQFIRGEGVFLLWWWKIKNKN
jgi:hypothetical protein